jgi:hypothetical protein
LKPFLPHPHGTSKEEDFNILYHIKLKPISSEEKKDEEEE